MKCQVREAAGSDEQAIAGVVKAAFGTEQGREIAELIAALSANPSAELQLALVATVDNRIVGYILLTSA